jgi:cell wall-associated NlpC family hydrolase/GH24 family phage-related lysozyme (muramidase)
MGQAMKGMAAINSNLGQLVGMPEMMQVEINNASKFFEDTTGKLDRITELLDVIAKNSTPSNELAESNSKEEKDFTYSDIVNSKGMPDLKKYFKTVGKNIKNSSSELDMLGNMFGGGNIAMTFAASPLEELTKMAVRQFVPKILESSMDQLNGTLQGFFGSIISKINRGYGSDNPITNWISKIFGIDSSIKDQIDPSKYEKGRVAWDGASRKALIEVIPGQLAKIVSALTGETPRVFDPESGSMISLRAINDTAGQRLQNSANYAGDDIRGQIYQALEDAKYSFGSYREKENFEKDLDLFFKSAFENGGIDGKSLKRRGTGGLNDIGIFNSSRLLEAIFGRMAETEEGRRALMKYNGRILKERDSLTNRTKYLESKGTVETFLSNGMFEDYLREEDTDDNKKRRAAGVNTVNSLSGVQTFAKQIDQYGHNMFYYMQQQLLHLQKIYEFTGFIADGGVGSGYVPADNPAKDEAAIKGKNLERAYRVRNGRFIRSGHTLELGRIEEDPIHREDNPDNVLAEYESRQAESYKSSRDAYRNENPDFTSDYSDDNSNDFHFKIDAARNARKIDEGREEKNWIDKMLHEKTLEGKLGFLHEKMQDFLNKPLESVAKMIDGADQKMYDLIYGEDLDEQIEKKGIIGVLKDSIENTFSNINDWVDENVLVPLKAKLEGRDGEPGLVEKIFKKFGWDYEEFKRKKSEGLFGKVGDDGVRSGGVFGDYIQDVKNNAKGAWSWVKDAFKDTKDSIASMTGLDQVKNPYADEEVPLGQYAMGGQVKKTGIAAVSEGELIIPSELNPYYHGKTDKKQQMKDEDNAVKKFFGKFSKGSISVGMDNTTDKDAAISMAEEETKESALAQGFKGADLNELHIYLQKLKPGKDAEHDSNKLIDFYIGKAKAWIKSNKHLRKKLKGQDKQIVEYDNDKGEYMLNDGSVIKMKAGQYVKKVGDQAKLFAANTESFAGDVGGELVDAVSSVYHGYIDARKGSSTPENQAFDEMMGDIKQNFTKQYAGATTVGAGIGGVASLLTGMVGGPLLGAAIGGAVGLTLKSNKVQEWLFGKEVDTEEGKKLEGGVLSEKTSKFIKEKLPGLAKAGLVGGAVGTITGHPLLGTMIGAGVGYAKTTEKFQNLLFNRIDGNGKINKGILNMTSDEFNKMLERRLPKMGAGAAVGMLAGPFGPVGNMILGSAVGFVSDTDKFKDSIFGKVNEKTGKREGGLIRDLTNTMFGPMIDFTKEQMGKITTWLDEEIMGRITKSIEPIAHYFETQGKRFVNWIGRGLKGAGSAIGGSVLGRRIYRRFIEPVRGAAGTLARGAIGIAKAPITFAAKRLENAGLRGQAHDIRLGYTDNMTIDEVMDAYKNNKFLNRDLDTNFEGDSVNGTKFGDMYRMQAGVKDLKDAGDAKTLRELYNSVTAMDDISKGYGSKRDDIVKEMRSKTLDNYTIRQVDKDRLVKMVKKGKLNEDNIDEALKDVRAVGRGTFNAEDKRKLREALLAGNQKLLDLDSDYTTIDDNGKTKFEKDQEKIIKKQMEAFGIKDDDFAKFIFGNKVQRERFSELLDNTMKQMEEEGKEKEESKPPEEKVTDSVTGNFNNLNEQMQNRHVEITDLIKQAINAIASRTGEPTQFDSSGQYIGPRENNINSRAAAEESTDEPKTTKPKNDTAKDTKKKNSKSDKDNEDSNDDSEDDNSSASIMESIMDNYTDSNPIANELGDLVGEFAKGGRVRKTGLAAVSKGELILPKFYGKFANGGMIGGNTITNLDGTYVYDAESHEYEAADAETRANQAKKEKMRDSLVSIPDKLDSMISAFKGAAGFGDGGGEEEEEESGLLSSILNILGFDGDGIMGKLTGLLKKGVGLAKGLIGPVIGVYILTKFFSGKFDGIINGIGKVIKKSIFDIIGISDEENDNVIDDSLSQSGENGEAGASDIVKKSLGRSFLKGGTGFKVATEVASRVLPGGKVLKKVANGASNLYNKGVNKLISKATGQSVEDLSKVGLIDVIKNGGLKNAINAKNGVVDAVTDVAEDTVGNALKSGDSTSLLSALYHEGDDIAETALKNADDVAEAATKSGGLWNTVKSVASKFTGKSAAKTAEKATEEAAQQSLKETAKSSGKTAIMKVFNAIKSKLPSKAQKILPDVAEEIAEEGAEQVGKKAAKEGAESATKLIPIAGQVIAVASFILDYVDGYSKASSYLGIEEPSTAECMISGVLNALLGLAFPISLIPVKTLVTILYDKLLPALGIDSTEAQKKRQEFSDKVDAYNEENDTDYSTEEYNNVVNNRQGFWKNTWQNVKSVFSSKSRTNRDSMLDSDGNVIAGGLNKNAKRWKKFWQKKVSNGMDESYAEAIYRDEMLHDSKLSLTDEKREELESAIQSYQNSDNAQTLPDITVDLPNLINKNKTNGQKSENVSYGNSTTKDYIGNYATGGVVSQDGLAAVSEGEAIVDAGDLGTSGNSTFLSKLIGKFGSIFSNIFGSSGDTSGSTFIDKIFGKSLDFGSNIDDYETLTDLSSFISEMLNLDTDTNSWKEFWEMSDSDDVKVSSNMLKGVRMMLKRLVAVIVSPVFSVKKTIPVLSDILGSLVDANGDDDKDDTKTSDDDTTKTSDTEEKTSFFSKAVSAVKSFFGGGSSLNNAGANYDSDDGTFISQMSSKYANKAYGDSSYADEGCAPATAAMFVNAVKGNNEPKSVGMEDAANYAIKGGYKVKDDGTKNEFFGDYFGQNGIDTEAVDGKNIYSDILAGKPTVLLGKDADNKSKTKSPFGKNPHYVLATGTDDKGNIIVNDPEAQKGGIRYNKSILNSVSKAVTTKQNGGGTGRMKSKMLRKNLGELPGFIIPAGFKRYGGATGDTTCTADSLTNMHVSENGLQLIKNCESFQGTAYKLAGESNYTIGYGHAASDVKAGDTVTEAEATELLKKDVQWAEECVRKGMVGKPWIPNQNQFNAMTYYCYGRGSGACKELFEKCTTEEEFSDGLVKYWGSATRYKKGLLRGKVKLQALFNSNDLRFVPGSEYNVVADKIFAGDTTASYKDVTPSESSYITLSDGAATTIDDTSTASSSGDSSSSDSSVGGLIGNVFRKAAAKYLSKIYGSSYANSLLGDSSSSSSSDTTTTSDTSSGSYASASGDGQVSDSTTIGQDVADDSANYIGNKYVWGGNDLDNGIDCSGFVQQLYKKHGFTIYDGRGTTKTMWADTKYGKKVDATTYNDLKPGDVMFFSNNGSASGIHHVGIYAGNGIMNHAQSTKTGIVKTDLSQSSSYQKQFLGAKRYGSGSGLNPSKVISAARLFGGESENTTPEYTADEELDATDVTDTSVDTSNVTDDTAAAASTTKKSRNKSFSSSSSSVDLSTVTDAINSLLEVLNKIADNTSSIASICDLIKGISDKSSSSDDSDNSKKSTKPTTSTSGTDSGAESSQSNIQNVVSILTALAQA